MTDILNASNEIEEINYLGFEKRYGGEDNWFERMLWWQRVLKGNAAADATPPALGGGADVPPGIRDDYSIEAAYGGGDDWFHNLLICQAIDNHTWVMAADGFACLAGNALQWRGGIIGTMDDFIAAVPSVYAAAPTLPTPPPPAPPFAVGDTVLITDADAYAAWCNEKGIGNATLPHEAGKHYTANYTHISDGERCWHIRPQVTPALYYLNVPQRLLKLVKRPDELVPASAPADGAGEALPVGTKVCVHGMAHAIVVGEIQTHDGSGGTKAYIVYAREWGMHTTAQDEPYMFDLMWRKVEWRKLKRADFDLVPYLERSIGDLGQRIIEVCEEREADLAAANERIHALEAERGAASSAYRVLSQALNDIHAELDADKRVIDARVVGWLNGIISKASSKALAILVAHYDTTDPTDPMPSTDPMPTDAPASTPSLNTTPVTKAGPQLTVEEATTRLEVTSGRSAPASPFAPKAETPTTPLAALKAASPLVDAPTELPKLDGKGVQFSAKVDTMQEERWKDTQKAMRASTKILVAAKDLQAGDEIYDSQLREFVVVKGVNADAKRAATHTEVHYYAANAHPISRNRSLTTFHNRKFETRKAA